MICKICNKEIKNTLFSSSVKCADGEICAVCKKRIPPFLVPKNYMGHECKTWITYTEQLQPLFQETSVYGSLKLDELHGLICISANEKGSYFAIKDISNLAITLKNLHAKERQVYADVLFSFEMKAYAFSYKTTIKRNVRCPMTIEGNKATNIEEPYDLSMFRQMFQQAIRHQYDEAMGMLNALSKEKFTSLQKAKALFMVEDDVEEEELKKVRNVLIKAFHPDNSGMDARYTRIINERYEQLKKGITE